MKRAAVIIAAVLLSALVAGVWRHRAEGKRQRDAIEYAALWDLEHGKADRAVEQLKALQALEPERPGLDRAIGKALTSAGRPTEALPVLSRALVTGADAEALEFEGVAHAQLGALPAARQALTRALEQEPSRVSAWRRLAQVSLTLGDDAAAVASWKQALTYASAAEREQIRLEARTLLTTAERTDALRALGLDATDGGRAP